MRPRQAFSSASIGGAIATRAIMVDLRVGGDVVGGPAPFTKADRSGFLQALDQALVRVGRRAGERPFNLQRVVDAQAGKAARVHRGGAGVEGERTAEKVLKALDAMKLRSRLELF